MADITLVKPHNVEIPVLRERLQGLADWLKKKYGIRSHWEGDSCILQGSGLKRGVVAVTPSEVQVDVTLSMMAKFLKAEVRKQIDEKIGKAISG
jgi:putative polyhydroxyalkanoate system protein